MKNRLIGAICAAVMLLALFAPMAMADGVCGESVSWTLTDAGVLTVFGEGAMTNFAAGEAPWYAERGAVRKLVVENGVTSVGSGAFSGCGLIETVTLPLTLGSIGDGAFDDVYALKNIYYAGSIAQWKAIDIGLDNSFGSAKLVCADKTEPFSDISGWYHDYIITCYMADIVNGRPDGTFCPEQNVTRAQFVMMLYNMGGRPEISDTSLGFADANAVSAVYAAAVKWGVKAGIVTGFTDNTFRPNAEISRAQMATFAYRFLKLGVSADVLGELSGRNDFRDYGSIAECYRESVDVMANIGVIQGYPNGSFVPNATATRGQSAAVLSRLLAALTELRTCKKDRLWQMCVRQHYAEINEAARNRMELIVPELVKRNGVTKKLKAENQMEWVRQMNACKAQAEKVVKAELIYD